MNYLIEKNSLKNGTFDLMKMDIKYVWIFFIAAFMSCSSPKMLEYKEYKNFKVNSAGFTSSKISLDLVYYNPNNFGLQLRKVDMDIFIDNNLLGHTLLDTLIQIPRKNTFTLPISVDVDMHNIFKNSLITLMGKEVTVKAIGRLKIGKANVFMSMPVNYEGKHTFSMF